MNIKYIPSSAGVIKAVARTDENIYGTQEVDKIVPGVPAIVVLGGELTYVPRFANHYIKQIKRVLAENNVSGTDIYSVFYEFGSRDAALERIQMFQAARHKVQNSNRPADVVACKMQHMQSTEPTANYIKQLYKALIHPILVLDTAGVQPNVVATLQNASKLRFYCHSHGAAVARMLGNLMRDEMLNMGFKASDIKQIQQSIVVIQHGPIVPLEYPYFTTLSFMSASDTRMNFHNAFSKYASENSENIYPSYFPQAGAHLFVAGQISRNFGNEHDNIGLAKEEFQTLTDDGRIIFAAERNAITNAVKTAIAGVKVPSVRELVSGPGVDFNELVCNGEWFYKLMMTELKQLRQQNLKHVNQK
ncbi:MAG: hypothetical protein IJX89_00470 [Alphaproteobacteria bacterium]|nr:hypothetical protein [Alphaproteobacteria bacterium]